MRDSSNLTIDCFAKILSKVSISFLSSIFGMEFWYGGICAHLILDRWWVSNLALRVVCVSSSRVQFIFAQTRRLCAIPSLSSYGQGVYVPILFRWSFKVVIHFHKGFLCKCTFVGGLPCEVYTCGGYEQYCHLQFCPRAG